MAAVSASASGSSPELVLCAEVSRREGHVVSGLFPRTVTLESLRSVQLQTGQHHFLDVATHIASLFRNSTESSLEQQLQQNPRAISFSCQAPIINNREYAGIDLQKHVQQNYPCDAVVVENDAVSVARGYLEYLQLQNKMPAFPALVLLLSDVALGMAIIQDQNNIFPFEATVQNYPLARLQAITSTQQSPSNLGERWSFLASHLWTDKAPNMAEDWSTQYTKNVQAFAADTAEYLYTVFSIDIANVVVTGALSRYIVPDIHAEPSPPIQCFTPKQLEDTTGSSHMMHLLGCHRTQRLYRPDQPAVTLKALYTRDELTPLLDALQVSGLKQLTIDYILGQQSNSILCVAFTAHNTAIGILPRNTTALTLPSIRENSEQIQWNTAALPSLFRTTSTHVLSPYMFNPLAGISFSVPRPIQNNSLYPYATAQSLPRELRKACENVTHIPVIPENDTVSWAKGCIRYLELTEAAVVFPSLAFTLTGGVGIALVKSATEIESIELTEIPLSAFPRLSVILKREEFNTHIAIMEAVAPDIRTKRFHAFVEDLQDHFKNTRATLPPITSILVGGEKSNEIAPMQNAKTALRTFPPEQFQKQGLAPHLLELLGCQVTSLEVAAKEAK